MFMSPSVCLCTGSLQSRSHQWSMSFHRRIVSQCKLSAARSLGHDGHDATPDDGHDAASDDGLPGSIEKDALNCHCCLQPSLQPEIFREPYTRS